jgi:hypothetical protein
MENNFAKIKEFLAIATRYDKADTSYAAILNLVATIIAARSMSTGTSTPANNSFNLHLKI